jgi:hypothetical protein
MEGHMKGHWEYVWTLQDSYPEPGLLYKALPPNGALWRGFEITLTKPTLSHGFKLPGPSTSESLDLDEALPSSALILGQKWQIKAWVVLELG